MPSLNTYIRSILVRFSYGTRPNPARDWTVLLIISALALTTIASWNLWVFDTIVNGGTLGNVSTSTQPVFSQASISTIRDLFDTRSAEALKYTDGSYRFSDPSR